jgi:hypothetical protein
MGIKKVRWGDMDCVVLAQDIVRWWALVNVVSEPLASIKCGEIHD